MTAPPTRPAAPVPDPVAASRRDRTGDVRLLCVLFAALALASIPGALRVRRLDEAPRLDAAPVRIALNRAPEAELEALPGVGPSLAARIAAARADGPIRSEADLRRVPGVGPSLASRIAPHADFDPAPPDR